MIINFKVGDIVESVFAGVKESRGYKLVFLSDWYWGHSVLIDKKPMRYEVGDEFIFDHKPDVDIANLGDTKHEIVVAFTRID
jgi:hypothetical protein